VGSPSTRYGERRIKLKNRLSVLLMGALMLALTAAPALAQGKFEQGTDHANSICSFSGLNDNPNEEFPENGRVQSYGQIVNKLIRAGVVEPGTQGGKAAPGTECNGHLNPLQEGNPEE
jgi:hypothetical protein